MKNAKKGKKTTMKYENEMEIDVGRCLRALAKRWRFLLAMAILCGIAGIILTMEKKEDTYQATSSVYAMSGESYSNAQMGVSAMNDYADIATSMKVCERAALLMGNANVTGEDIMKATSVSTGKKSSSAAVVQDSTILKITSEYTDPVVAMEMSQAVAEAFSIEMENILGTDAVRILDKPYSYKVSFDATQHQWMIRIISLVAGLLIGAAVVVFGEVFDSRARTIRECTMRDDLPIIGVIPRYKD